MSDATREARRLLGSLVQSDRDRGVAWAQLAQAEALEHLADTLQMLADRG